MRGADGRAWAVTDAEGKLGSGKSTRRFRRMDGLLDLSATYDGGRVPVITFPDGQRVSGDDADVHGALSRHLRRDVRLRLEGDVSHFDEGPLHLVTTAAMTVLAEAHGGPVGTARLRPNLLIELPTMTGLIEDGWIGRVLAIGPDLVVRIREPMVRCVMVNLSQVGLPADTGLLNTTASLNDAAFGVVADVLSPGLVSLNDPVNLVR